MVDKGIKYENARLHRRVIQLESSRHHSGGAAYDVMPGSKEWNRIYGMDAKRGFAKEAVAGHDGGDEFPYSSVKEVHDACRSNMQDDAVEQLMAMLAESGKEAAAADEPQDFSGMPHTGGTQSPVFAGQNSNINSPNPAQDAARLAFDTSHIHVDPYKRPVAARVWSQSSAEAAAFSERFPGADRIKVI